MWVSPEATSGACAAGGAALGAGAGLGVGVGWQAGPSAPRSAARARRAPRRRVVASATIIEHQNRSGPGGQGQVTTFLPGRFLPACLLRASPCRLCAVFHARSAIRPAGTELAGILPP